MSKKGISKIDETKSQSSEDHKPSWKGPKEEFKARKDTKTQRGSNKQW
ncbi:MAG: hypothetical protein Q8900_04215 [Bacillota bacterium]|nr:hypothetical protein [Bacillota bacterium]